MHIENFDDFEYLDTFKKFVSAILKISNPNGITAADINSAKAKLLEFVAEYYVSFFYNGNFEVK